VNQLLLIAFATVFSWIVGYFYFRWIWSDLSTDTAKLTFFLGPFSKSWRFPAGSIGQRVNATVHWFQLLVAIVIGGPIMLFFMLLMPWAFVNALWPMLAG
jgi:hypothetical protein